MGAINGTYLTRLGWTNRGLPRALGHDGGLQSGLGDGGTYIGTQRMEENLQPSLRPWAREAGHGSRRSASACGQPSATHQGPT